MTPLLFLSFALAAPPERPEPRPLAGGALPPGAVARLGPDAFRHAGFAGSPVYSRDGKRVAVTSGAGAWVWDAGTGRRLVSVPADDRTVVTFLGFGPAGDVLVTCRRKGDDTGAGVFRVDPAAGKVTAKFQPPDDRRFAAAGPDGKVVYSFTSVNAADTETVANELDTGKELWRRKHPEMAWMRVSPDGSRLVVWSSRAVWEPEVLDAATGKTVGRFVHSDGYPTWPAGAVGVGPKAERVIAAHAWNRGFTVFEAGSEKPAFGVTGTWHENAFLVGDGDRAVLVDNRRGGYRVEVWDLAARKRLSALDADVGSNLALSPDGKTLAATGDHRSTGTLHFFDVATGKKLPLSPEPFTRAAVLWYLPDGTLASADEELTKPVKWDVKTGAMTTLPGGTKPPASPVPGPDFKPPEGTVNVVLSPDGKRAFGYRFDPDELDSSPGDTYLGLFDGRGRLVKQFLRPDHTGGATYGFAADGKTFAVARGDGTITLFESDGGKELRTLRHAGGASTLAFSPDGKFLATACGDGPILVWDVAAKP